MSAVETLFWNILGYSTMAMIFIVELCHHRGDRLFSAGTARPWWGALG